MKHVRAPKKSMLALNRYIFSHYARSALIPILAIEITLLVIYFAVNSYTTSRSEETLRKEVTAIMPHLVKKQADIINADFEAIARQTKYFAEANEELLRVPNGVLVSGESPQFAVAPTGALYQTNRDTGSALYYTHASRLSASQKLKARSTAALDPLYRHLVQDIPHVAAAYLNTPDNMNRIYPFIPEIYKQYPPDLNMADYNFYYLADLKHNPEKKPVWTGVYLDPAGQGWMLSCIAPVYLQDSLAGVVGLDVTIATIVKQVLTQELPWGATAFLADKSGMILAMSPRAEEILGLKELKEHVYNTTIAKEQLKPEEFNLLKSKDPQIAETFKKLYETKRSLGEIKIEGEGELFIVGDQVKATGWKLFMVTESGEVLKSVNAVSQLSHRIGLFLIAGMLLFYFFFFLFLRKQAGLMSAQIANPVRDISLAAMELGRSNQLTELPHSDIRELEDLTQTFSQMAYQLKGNSEELVKSEVRAKVQEKEAELSYAKGMYESASGYLHNVGNSITQLDSSLMDLDGIVKSTEQYPAVFEKLLHGDITILERFRSVLLEKTVPKIYDISQEIRRVKETIQHTIQHQQQSFKSSRINLSPVKFDLAELIKEASREIVIPNNLSLELDLPTKLEITHQKNQIHDGVLNLIKNAVESCGTMENAQVSVKLLQGEDMIQLVIKDNGSGIKSENLMKMMSAGFTTKPNGNGLGLHSFAVFLSANNGSIRFESGGVNKGAVAIVEIKNA